MTRKERTALCTEVLKILRTECSLKSDGSDCFRDEIFADYRDEMNGKEAGEIIDADYPAETFFEKMDEWYRDAEWYYRRELIDDVIKRLMQRDVFSNGLNEEQKELVHDCIWEHVTYDYPVDHFLDQEMYVNIMIDAGDGNYDFSLNSVFPCWYGRYGDRISDKAGIVWLAKTQGYTKTQLWNALKKGDMKNPHGFLQSMRVELANLPSHMATVTFLVKMSFRQLLELNEAIQWRERQGGRKYDPKDYPNCGYIVLDKKTMCGLYDPWSGGGSVLEVELEKDVRIPVKLIWLAIPDEAKGHGYQIGDVYGMCGSAWRPTLKEMSFPKNLKEAV